ncbi:hypothetical protein KC717_00410 [Candidatus Dojkabacteria bacterium]|uniref:Uncharacterized protein n=1 Tax=Candidatus Dojkabacteria bacterium TaxID=2099670 RepID=A0A955RJQ2_9BACT|nr:hypothetical protein [Candidatus Dojkabacteria bacterium]
MGPLEQFANNQEFIASLWANKEELGTALIILATTLCVLWCLPGESSESDVGEDTPPIQPPHNDKQ